MRQLSKYAFANAKVRALLSFLLKQDEFSRLLDVKDLHELLEALKNTSYKDIISALNIENPDLALLEKELSKNNLNIYRKVYDSLPGKNERSFVRLLMQRYELEELKLALRFWHKKEVSGIDDYLLGEKISFDIDFNKIISAHTIEDIISLLGDTPYKKPILKARDKFKNSGSLFFIETSLSLDYYERLLAMSRGLSLVDRKVAQKILGIEIDSENISWLIKGIKYYSLDKAQILDWIIPGGERIAKKRIEGFHTINDLSKITESLAIGPYTRIKDLAESSIHLIESFLYEILLREVKKALGSFPFTIGTIFGYLILKQREIKNIISLIYVKRYNLKKEELKIC